MAAMPETCGQAIEVPESIKKSGGFLPASFTTESLSGHEARMATPGAATSGCKVIPILKLIYVIIISLKK